MYLINAIILLALLMITAIGAKLLHKDGQGLSIEQGNCLKGLAAVLVVIIHIRNSLQNPGYIFNGLNSIGYLYVSVFFFYSGYGITKKSTQNIRYLTRGMVLKFFSLFRIIVITEIIYYCFAVLLFGRVFDLTDMLLCLIGVRMLNGAMWYMVALLIIIAFFAVANMTALKEKHTIKAAAAIVFYLTICIIRNRAPHEMQSCIAFVIGAYIAENETAILHIGKQKRRRKVLPIAVVTFAVCLIVPYLSEYLTGRDYGVVRVVFGSGATAGFIVILNLFVNEIKLENSVLKWLGTMYLEIYLSHQLIINLVALYFPGLFLGTNHITVTIIVIACVLAVSISIKQIRTVAKGISLRGAN